MDLKRDGELAEQARRKAEVILEVDPRLENPDNQTLREKLNRRFHGLLNLAQIS